MPTPSTSKSRHVSQKANSFTESVIREMTREALKHGAVNLSQGFPDFAAPDDIKQKAMEAIANDINQYAITWGSKDFRDAITRKTKWHLGLDIDPETEITVTCGSTEGMIAAMMATVDPGEEVIVFEPYYENYGPDTWLCGAERKLVTLRIDGAVPQRGARLFAADRDVGFVTSAAVSPRLGTIAMGYVHRDFLTPGTTLDLATDSGRVPATVTERVILSGA